MSLGQRSAYTKEALAHFCSQMNICKMKANGFTAVWLFSALLADTLLATEPKECDRNVIIKGGNYTLSKGYEIDSILQYSCPAGMYPYPVRTRKCGRSGMWTPMYSKGKSLYEATCKAVTCPGPLDIEYGSFIPRQSSFAIGSTITFECYEGYTLTGSASRTCKENGKWSGSTAICDDGAGDCSNPGIPIGAIKSGSAYMIEDKVTYKCEKGLNMLGSRERICEESREWTGTEPACYAPYTFDTPEEVAESFSASLSAVADASDLNKTRGATSFRKIKIEQGGLLYIYILLDASESVGEEEFNKEKDTANSLIEKISTFDVNPRYAILSFASEPKTIISLSDPESGNAAKVLEKLKQFQYAAHEDKSGTNTREALEKVYEMMVLKQEQEKDNFQKIRHVIILMTDGKANMGGSPTVSINKINSLLGIIKPGQGDPREEFLDVYVFGVGEADPDEINALGSKKDKEKHVYIVAEITDLQKVLDNIIDETGALKMCGLSKTYDGAESNVLNPWQAFIEIVRSRTTTREKCVGSIVSEYFIITAAHCFRVEDEVREISVKVGGISGKSYKVKELYVHPGYKINSKKDKNITEFYDYDIALIKLEQKLNFEERIRPICIPCTEGTTRALRKMHPQTTCKDHYNELLGVANPDAFFVDHTDQQRKWVTIKRGDSGQQCNADAKKASIYVNVTDVSEVVTPRFLCTGAGEIDQRVEPVTCKGDSGGPLFIHKKGRHVQVGVISWGVFDACDGKLKKKKVPNYARDFHINLFEVQHWLRKILEDELNFIN